MDFDDFEKYDMLLDDEEYPRRSKDSLKGNNGCGTFIVFIALLLVVFLN